MLCNICLENFSDGIECSLCEQLICLICFSKLDICPYCRNNYNIIIRKKKKIHNIEKSMRRIEELLISIGEGMSRIEYLVEEQKKNNN